VILRFFTSNDFHIRVRFVGFMAAYSKVFVTIIIIKPISITPWRPWIHRRWHVCRYDGVIKWTEYKTRSSADADKPAQRV